MYGSGRDDGQVQEKVRKDTGTRVSLKPGLLKAGWSISPYRAHSGEFVHRFRSCRPVAEGSNAGGRIINQVDGMGSWNLRHGSKDLKKWT